MKYKISIFLFIYILIFSIINKANTVVIEGVIKDKVGFITLEQAIVVLIEKDTLINETSSSGEFSFIVEEQLLEGILEITHAGYKTFKKKVSFEKNIYLEIFLENEMLDESVVMAKSKALLRTEKSGEVYLNTSKINRIPSLLGVPDMLKVLQLMPGVQNSGEANGYLYVRGADPGHNFMQYAGAPVYGMAHLLGIFPFYNADHIEQVKFDKSGAQAKNGNRLSSTIQALTSEDIPNSLSIKGNIGLLASQLSLQVPIGSKIGFSISGRKSYIDEIITPLINSGSEGKGAIEELKYSLGDLNFSGIFKPSPKHQFTFDAFISDDRFKIHEKEMLLDGSLKWDNHTFSSSWTWETSKNLRLKQTIYSSRYSNRLNVSQALICINSRSLVSDWGILSDAEFNLNKINFETGIQFSNYNLNPQDITSIELGFNNDRKDNRLASDLLSVYLQAKSPLFSSLSMNIGLRLNAYRSSIPSTKHYLSPEPRISFNYEFSENNNFHITYARKNQFLNLITTSSVGFPTDFWLAASDKIPFQYADNFSTTFTTSVSRKFKIDVGGFYNRMNRLLEYPFSILQFNQVNGFEEDLLVGKGLAYGAEVMIRKNGRISGWLSYTVSKSERKFDEINQGIAFPAKFDRRHNLSLVLSYELSKKWNIGFTQIYSSGNRFTAASSWYFINNNPVKEYGKLNDAQMPTYIRSDLSMDFIFKKTVNKENILNFSIYNMFSIVNPIYTSMRIRPVENTDSVEVVMRFTKLYTILPSISWRFKF